MSTALLPSPRDRWRYARDTRRYTFQQDAWWAFQHLPLALQDVAIDLVYHAAWFPMAGTPLPLYPSTVRVLSEDQLHVTVRYPWTKLLDHQPLTVLHVDLVQA